MTQKKSRLETSRDEWKAKNKARYEEIKALKMRLKETVENRNKWKTTACEKEKALAEKEQKQNETLFMIASLKEELEDLKKNKRF
jgi:hypothetical protein